MSLVHYHKKRTFSTTPEPRGSDGDLGRGSRFSVQEHHARRLHYDLRLEHDGVLKSWAIPKGLPDQTGVRRLAVQTEDHPLDYLTFEGDIPKGNYGAGSVRLWDVGRYESVAGGPDHSQWSIRFDGTRVSGRYELVRLRADRNGPASSKPSWLILRGRAELPSGGDPLPERILPMLATSASRPFSNPQWLFEPKWDGIRVIARLSRGTPHLIELSGRTGDRITARYPEVVERLTRLLDQRPALRTLVLDGEVVALDEQGRPSFERLQGRIHVMEPEAIARARVATPVEYIPFDCLFVNGQSLLARPLSARRDVLEDALGTDRKWPISRAVVGDGEAVFHEAVHLGMEGMVAKRAASLYAPGLRSRDWIKVRRADEVEAVIGGWTEGRGQRSDTVGALLLGLYDDGRLRFIGKTGAGQTAAALQALHAELTDRETRQSPFADRPDVVGRLHWVRPELGARVRFAEWTRAKKLRAPILLGWTTLDPTDHGALTMDPVPDGQIKLSADRNTPARRHR